MSIPFQTAIMVATESTSTSTAVDKACEPPLAAGFVVAAPGLIVTAGVELETAVFVF